MTNTSQPETRSDSTRSRLVAQVGLCSERGARDGNEDYAGTLDNAARSLVIAAVADGVGGAKGGRVAAELAVRGFIEGCVGMRAGVPAKHRVIHSLQSINRWIHALGRIDANLEGMACTFTGVVCIGGQAHVVHVGDSRLYRLRGERLEQLTTDHRAGRAVSHILTRAIGAEADARIAYQVLQNEPHDRFLLCTDGVHDGVDKTTLTEILGRRAAPQDSAREIVDRALATRVGDNATALVLDLLELPATSHAELAQAVADSAILPAPAAGGVVDGYHLDTVLSDGRYTRVFRATDQVDGTTVVLKFPKPLPGAERIARENFLRELWLTSKVQSPFVGAILQPDAERQSRLYLVQRFYAGETLEHRLKRNPALTLTAGVDVALKLAKGVAALHRAGVIHRDIKPDNVLIEQPTDQGIGVKLIDFSVACEAHLHGGADASPQPGTPSFMAPELFEGQPASEASDQFALGVTVFRLFTGGYPYGEIEPFTYPTFASPAPLTASRPDLPAWLDRTIARAIAVKPDERYADVLEFMFALEHGADRASPVVIERKPLYHRNPLLFWQLASALLALLLAIALTTRMLPNRTLPAPTQPPAAATPRPL